MRERRSYGGQKAVYAWIMKTVRVKSSYLMCCSFTKCFLGEEKGERMKKIFIIGYVLAGIGTVLSWKIFGISPKAQMCLTLVTIGSFLMGLAIPSVLNWVINLLEKKAESHLQGK